MSANSTTQLSDNWRSWPPEAKQKLLARLQTSNGLTDLQSALRSCIAAESQIEPEQARIQRLWDTAIDPVERDARAYQHDLVALKLERFAAVARWRLKYLSSLRNKAHWDDEHAKCAARQAIAWLDPWKQQRETTGLIYWFALYAWAYDPRDLLKTQPFYPFDFQERLLARMDDAVFATRSSLLIDKSRDMGITWLLADWKLYHWRYTPGFAALSGNRTEDEVDDSKGDLGATFNKLRFQLKLLPAEMLPKGYDERKHNTYMNLTNPETGANISGGAPVEDFGRGDRRTVIDPDEFASWTTTKGYKQYQAMSQTTNSLLIASTVKGVFNKYGELLLNPAMPKFVVDWKDHPWKDERWYASLPFGYLGPPMSAVEIAQEVDRDPYASQPGQVLSQWKEVRNVITESEFWRVYGRLPQARRSVFPPLQWKVSTGQDVGTQPEHPNVTTWLTRPMESDPYPRSIFGVGEMMRIALSSRQIAEGVRDEITGRVLTPGFMQFEQEHQLTGRIGQRILSHEASSEQLAYMRDCREYRTTWSKWPGDANGGLEQWADLVQVQPGPNPFVIDPRTCDPQERWAPFVHKHYCKLCYCEHVGAHLDGYVEFMLVVPDDEGTLQITADGKLVRQAARTEKGFARLRYEIPGYHYPESEKGKPVKARKPEASENDACLVKGTMIDTLLGLRPIETIQAGDRVVTRKGLRTVIEAGLTRYVSTIYTLTIDNGKSLTGTGNHPVWTSRGWLPLVEIKTGDRVLCIVGQERLNRVRAKRASTLSSRACASIATRTVNSGHIGIISSRTVITDRKAYLSFMLRYGKVFTEIYRQIPRSIIETRIRFITSLAIWNACLRASINDITPQSETVGRRRISHILRPSDRFRLNGIVAKRATHGTESMQNNRYAGNRCSGLYVLGVQPRSNQHRPEPVFAMSTVKIVTVENTQPRPVFNLAVEDCHEYFAGGILAHNCDSIRMQLAYGMLVSARATVEQRIEAALPAPYQREAVAALSGEERSIAEQGRYQNYWMTKADIEADERNNSGLSVYER